MRISFTSEKTMEGSCVIDIDNQENCHSEIIQFLIADFQDLSEKLENTDKKVQFCTQLYITLITAIAVAIITNLEKIYQLVIELKLVSFILFGIFGIFSIIGELVFLYMLAGHNLHFSYVKRLNSIRKKILEEYGKDKKYIEAYGYTAPIPPKRTGMNYYMIYLILIIVLFFSLLAYLCFLYYENRTWNLLTVMKIPAIIFVVNVIIINYYHVKMEYN